MGYANDTIQALSFASVALTLQFIVKPAICSSLDYFTISALLAVVSYYYVPATTKKAGSYAAKFLKSFWSDLSAYGAEIYTGFKEAASQSAETAEVKKE